MSTTLLENPSTDEAMERTGRYTQSRMKTLREEGRRGLTSEVQFYGVESGDSSKDSRASASEFERDF